MTTCVYDRRVGVLGADTQYNSGGVIVRGEKIEQLPNGWWFAGAGDSAAIEQIKRWAKARWALRSRPKLEELLKIPDISLECLVVDPKTDRLWHIDLSFVPLLVTDPYLAIGSGGNYALGALDHGATVRQALAIAAKRDPDTSGPFTVEKLSGEA